MLTSEITEELLSKYKAIGAKYRDILKPNRKSGEELVSFLVGKYEVTEVYEKEALDAVIGNVLMNKPYAEKLPVGMTPNARAFYIENAGNGSTLYDSGNRDLEAVWGGEITKILVGIDTVTGFYMVEGSTLLWDELCAYRGLDELDLQNYVCVAQYIECLSRFGMLQEAVRDSRE